MGASDEPRSVLIASEPLTSDTSTWLEAPEYSLLAGTLLDGGLDFEILDLDV
jgi:glutamine amidotransferase